MSRVWFADPLETVASFWRIHRRDGVTLGFTTHDRPLRFDGVLHDAAPGMAPSAIRRSADFEPDSAEVEGALGHASISAADLVLGRYDGARVTIGLVDWETLERHTVFRGMIGAIRDQAGTFSARLQSRKAELHHDTTPRTSPTCRAEFCGPDCTVSAARYSHLAAVAGYDADAGSLTLAGGPAAALLVGGNLRWLDGPHAGQTADIVAAAGNTVTLNGPLDHAPPIDCPVRIREGCDRTLETCATRFGNAVNFQGEPFLPGNDMVTRYASPAA